MRKVLLTTLTLGALAFTISTPAAAQLTFRGGLNLSDFVGDDAGETDSKTGLNLGGAYSPIAFGPASVVLEVYYREKGAEQLMAIRQGQPVTGEVEVGLDYVEVPVLLRVDLPVGPNWLRPYLDGGPAFGWNLDCGISIDTETGTSENECDDLFGSQEQLEETIEDYEQGLVLGGGFDFHLPRRIGAINIDARYTRGLSRLAEGEDGLDVKNESFTVMLGYALGLGPLAGGPGR